MAHAGLFVALAATVDAKDIAIAGSGLYLSGNVGGVTGLSIGSAIFQGTLRRDLKDALHDTPDGKNIARRALEDYEFVRHLSGRVRDLVIGAYASSFRTSFAVPLVCCVAALLIGFLVKERRLIN